MSTFQLPYEHVSDVDLGAGISYDFKGLHIEIYYEGIVLKGTAEPFRTKTDMTALMRVLEVAKEQHGWYVANKKFRPVDWEWQL